ncbi:MAG: hypothetical protein ACXWTT_12695 [Methylobacter sp.]
MRNSPLVNIELDISRDKNPPGEWQNAARHTSNIFMATAAGREQSADN